MIFVGLLVAIIIMVPFGRWILGPLDRAARNRRHPVQFTMLDFFSLLFLLQLPLGVVHSFWSAEETGAVWVLDGFGWFATGLMWWISVRTLSRAGIHKPWHRVVFLLLVLPLAYSGIIAAPFLFAALLATFAQGATSGWDQERSVLLASILVILACAFYLSARFPRKMLSESEPPMAEPDRG